MKVGRYQISLRSLFFWLRRRISRGQVDFPCVRDIPHNPPPIHPPTHSPYPPGPPYPGEAQPGTRGEFATALGEGAIKAVCQGMVAHRSSAALQLWVRGCLLCSSSSSIAAGAPKHNTPESTPARVKPLQAAPGYFNGGKTRTSPHLLPPPASFCGWADFL